MKDVYIKLGKETDSGIIVSGAKVVATNSALTHYNMIGFGSAQVMGENPDFALMFVAPRDAEGVKRISRALYEMVAGATGFPYDYPLSSRFDENDAILVRDHGKGIPEEEISRVTEAFYMVDKSRSKKAGGIGLGLALCTQIVKLHGAKMEIKSKPGVGTQIRVIFSEEQ